jgi:RNA polymerase sigma-70 factor (ECF subfamily)
VLAKSVRRYRGTQRRDIRLEQQLDEQLGQSSQALGCALRDRGSSPSERVSRRERAVLLADALQALPEDYREVIILRHIEEQSFPEIARQMDRSLDSVKNIWTRALARLRQSAEALQ